MKKVSVIILLWLGLIFLSFNLRAESDPYLKGTAYLGQGNLQKAIIFLSKAIAVNPHNNYAYINRGLAYLEMEDFNRAKRDFLKALKIDPSNEISNNNLAILYFKIGDYEKALGYFRRALSFSKAGTSFQAAIYKNISLVYKLLGQVEDAKLAENRAIEIMANHKRSDGKHRNDSPADLWVARSFGTEASSCPLMLKIYEQKPIFQNK